LDKDYSVYKIKKTLKNYNYIIILGNSKKFYFDKLTNILHINIKNCNQNKIKKVMIALEWININTKYEFIYRITYSDNFNKYQIPNNYIKYDYYCNDIIDVNKYDNTEHSGKCHNKKKK
jgi:hypothetical protein